MSKDLSFKVVRSNGPDESGRVRASALFLAAGSRIEPDPAATS